MLVDLLVDGFLAIVEVLHVSEGVNFLACGIDLFFCRPEGPLKAMSYGKGRPNAHHIHLLVQLFRGS